MWMSPEVILDAYVLAPPIAFRWPVPSIDPILADLLIVSEPVAVVPPRSESTGISWKRFVIAPKRIRWQTAASEMYGIST